MKRMALISCLSLCACAGSPPPEERIVTKEAMVAVPVACKPDIGLDPDYPDTDAALAAAPNIFERAKLVMAGRKLRIQRQVELWAALAGCMGS